MSGCFLLWIEASAGQVEASKDRFDEAIVPLIEQLHKAMPPGQRLDRDAVTGMIYDRLAAAGIEVRIRPPLKAHCVGNGPG